MGTRTKLGVFPGHSFPHSPSPSLSQTPGSYLWLPHTCSLSILHLQER